MKFVDWKVGFADNFTKFPALANNFYEARKNCENFRKFLGLANNF